MTSRTKQQSQQAFTKDVEPQTSRYKEGDIVHLEKKKEFDSAVYKKSSVDDIADAQVSAVSKKVTYTMNMREAQT